MSDDTTATEPKRNIYQRLHAAMRDVGYIQKDGYNSFSKYKYVTHDAVVEHVRKALVQHGIVVVTSTPEVEFPAAATTNAGKANNICRVRLVVRFVNADEPSEFVETEFWGEASDTGDKAIYKAISGAKKYAFTNMFMLATGDDPEQASPEYQQRATATKQPKATQPKADAVNDPDPGAKFKEVRKSTGMSNDDMMAALGDGFKALDDKGKCDALYLLERKFSAKQDIADHIEKYKIDAPTFDAICAKLAWVDPWHKNELKTIEAVADAIYIKGEE